VQKVNELGASAVSLLKVTDLKWRGMCRCEVSAPAQKLQHLENGVSYLQKLNDLSGEEYCEGTLAGMAHDIKCHPDGILPERYQKSKRNLGSAAKKQSRDSTLRGRDKTRNLMLDGKNDKMSQLERGKNRTLGELMASAAAERVANRRHGEGDQDDEAALLSPMENGRQEVVIGEQEEERKKLWHQLLPLGAASGMLPESPGAVPAGRLSQSRRNRKHCQAWTPEAIARANHTQPIPIRRARLSM